MNADRAKNQSRRLTVAFTDRRDRWDRRAHAFESSELRLYQSGSDYWIASYTSPRPRERVRHADALRDELNFAATRDPDFAIPYGCIGKSAHSCAAELEREPFAQLSALCGGPR